MDSKIVFALRRRYHCEQARNVLRQNGLDHPIFEIDEEDISYAALRHRIPPEARIIITGDVYASAMMERLELAVVTIRRSKIPFDHSIRQALKIADRAALLWRESDSPAAQRACLPFGEAVSFFPTEDHRHDFTPLFEKLKEMGFRVVIGAASLNDTAQRYGMEVVNVPYDEGDILSAVRLAEHNLHFIEELQESAEVLRSIQDNITEGIVALDTEGIIRTANRIAADILQMDPRTLGGLSVERMELICDEVRELLRGFEPFDNKVLTIKGVSVAVSGRPVFVRHVFRSAILTMTPVEQLQRSEQYVRAQINARPQSASVSFQDIVGESPVLIEAIRTAQRYARVDSSVLVYGQSGTGKEMFVQSIHNSSARRTAPFVVINCAALPESLIESELFGYEKGAFTGALSGGKQGLFERGHKGTVFLDEISEMPLHIQARFLRVLQEREVTPIGGHRVIPVDIRVIAATNRDLLEMVEKKQFREDLYYRISVLTMQLPPLDQRGNDIELLVRHFVKTKSKELSLDIHSVEPEAIHYFSSLSYPGNIRQLSNLVERAMVLCRGDSLDLEAAMTATTAGGLRQEAPRSSNTMSAIHILQEDELRSALRRNHNNRAKTAKELGISVSTLYRRMKRSDDH